MSHPALENNRPDLVPANVRCSRCSRCSRIINKSDLVPANVLCSRCSRIINKSELIRLLLSGDKALIQRESQVKCTIEALFHSRSVRDILSSSLGGCHICSIISNSRYINPDNLDREDPQQGIIRASLWFDAYDEERNEGSLHLSIEDVFWLRVPEEAAKDYELLDGISREQLPRGQLPRGRWPRLINELRILTTKEEDFMCFQSGPPETDFLPSSTNSSQTLNVVRRWMDDCLQNHPECNQNFFIKGGGSSANVNLPTRLIFVGEEADGQLAPRLVLPRAFEPTKEVRYLTLSHSWAISGKSTILTIANMERFFKGIALEDLSQTFRDALIITRELGFQYIWIDSLCIIQDSGEDWEKEALTMSDVYGHSSCNIAACGVLGIDGCFLSRNPLPLFPCRLGPHSQEPGGNGGCGLAYVLKNELSPSYWLKNQGAKTSLPLLSRGWCMQERLLSPRVVYFGTQEVLWECCHNVVKESSPPKRWVRNMRTKNSPWVSQKARFQELCKTEYSTSDIKPPSRAKELGWFPLDKMKTVEPSILRLYLCWYPIVSDYSYASLTRTTDRLMAFAGIVNAIENSRGWTYVAGTWKEFWPLDLLWYFTTDTEQERRVDSGIPAPSWSWAAKEGGKFFLIRVAFDWYSFKNSTVTYMSQVVDYFCPPTLSQHCSGVITDDGEPGMTITLKGPVRRGVVGNDLGALLPPFERPVQLDNQYGLADSVKVKWDGVPAEGEPVLLLLVVTWENYREHKSTFQHVGLVLMPERNQPVTDGTSGMLYKRVGAWIACRAENKMDPLCLFFNGTEAEETVRIC